jgi:ABC-2 type transport system permease protein
MLRTIWSKTLREYRIPILGWGLLLGFIVYISLIIYGKTDTQGLADLAPLVQNFRFLADPIAVDTPEGIVTWRVLSFFSPLLLSIWALLAATRTLRGEEERASLDLLLAVPRSRTRIVVEKMIGLVLALLIIGIIISLGTLAGQASANLTIDATRALMTGLNISLLAFFFACVGLFLSQLLPGRGAAAGWTGLLLALSYLLDGTGRMLKDGTWLRQLTPFYAYDLNKPLLKSVEANYVAPVLLAGIGLLLIVVSAMLFSARDVGGIALPGWLHGRGRTVAPARVLTRAWRALAERNTLLRTLKAQWISIFCWLAGVAAMTFWFTALVPIALEPVHELIDKNPAFKAIFAQREIATTSGFLSVIVFQFLPILVIICVLVQAMQWPTDLDSGRMELVLSTPRARVSVLFERFLAVLIVALLAPLLIWLAVMLGVWVYDIKNIDSDRIATAAFSLLPLELLIIAAAYVLATRVRSNVIFGLITAYLALAFIGVWLQATLKLPDWLISLSIFYSYGNPVMDGWQWQPSTWMAGIAVLLLLIGAFQFAHTDIPKSA